MYRRVLIGGVTAAAIVGAGGTAIALTGSDTTAGTPTTATTTSTSAPAVHQHRHPRLRILHRLVHGQIVTRNGSGFVTHDLINGTVTAVSASSIRVRAADDRTETFAVTKDTKVRVRTTTGGALSSIGSVAVGDHVLVAGTGTSTYTARHIVDVKR
jgi:hypothetical protein